MFEQKYRKDELVKAYINTRSQNKAAEICGCSRETVARAVREAGIKLDGRKLNGGRGGGSAPKISDCELLEEAKTMTRFEIARKHSMNVCNIDRKLHRLGIKCVKANPRETETVGKVGSGNHYHERAAAYGVEYEPGISLKKVMFRDRGICKICGKPVNKASFNGKGCGQLYPTIDHIIPLSKGGGHTWDNVQLAHLGCNSTKGDNVEVRI